MLNWPTKDPDEVLDYTIDWAGRLGNDTIATSVWDVPAPLTSDNDEFTPSKTVIWLAGGAEGGEYKIYNEITTAGGRVMDQTVKLRVRSR